jgi:cytoskeletal protein RodZ
MLDKLVSRLVERAVPANLGDPHQEWIASEAAENAVHATARLAVLLGVLIALAVAGVLYYAWIPVAAMVERAPQPTDAVKALSADNARLLQANAELQRKLDDTAQERDALQGKVTAAEKARAETSPAPQPIAQAETPAQAPAQPAAQPVAKKPRPAEPAEARRAKPAPAPEAVLTIPHDRFQCGDGRTVRDPAACRAAGSASQARVEPAPRDSFQCGDGRSVRDPAECRAAAPPR